MLLLNCQSLCCITDCTVDAVFKKTLQAAKTD